MLAWQDTGPAQIRSLVPVEGNKSLPLIWSPAALLGPISRLLSRRPPKPQLRVSYLGLISVCPPREGSMAAGPSPTLDRPILGSPLPASLACFILSTHSLTFSPFHSCFPSGSQCHDTSSQIESLCNLLVKKAHSPSEK